MSNTRTPLFVLILLATGYCARAQENAFVLADKGKAAAIFIDPNERQVVHTAARLLIADIQAVTGISSRVSESGAEGAEGNIIAGSIGTNQIIAQLEQSGRIDLSGIRDKWEGFTIRTVDYNGRNTLVIAGSDSNGTAYGILEASRGMGVSPWHFFADVPIPRMETICLFGMTEMIPSVQYRGIFINDEDWGILPWASMTFDPGAGKGVISPRTHERIFELLLRLRANTFWPAMHECSVPFYLVPGNREMAEKYGIYIGTSHCEPMACNVNGEWKIRGNGEYDYTVNRGNVRSFWEERVKETAGRNTIYTLGMRGVHDGAMQGARTIEEQKKVLAEALADQREMLAGQVNEDLRKVPQVFIPYKEVLDVYNAGLEVPEDVTLMWCDDNYGYIRHFPTPEERVRRGGNGVYYHISYWGRPHDYLWLATTHPALLHHQMRAAWDYGMRKMWVVNVGDIKPAEYLTELFLDMAWNIEEVTGKGVNNHLSRWFAKTLDTIPAEELTGIMNEYYRLAFIRKPEFMGNTRVEEKDPAYTQITPLPWSEERIRERLAQYEAIAGRVKELSADIPPAARHAWFQLIEYPVLAANEMNKKLLYAQLAHCHPADSGKSKEAFDSIASLTQQYNSLNNGKWNRILDSRPRKLPVFGEAPHYTSAPPDVEAEPLAVLNGAGYSTCSGNIHDTQGLGYEGKAIAIGKGGSATWLLGPARGESFRVEVCLLPNHPIEGDSLRFLISIDGGLPMPVSYETKGRSEEWKMNVSGNRAIRKLTLPADPYKETHEINITALDEGVVLDQIIVKWNP